jgi:hypothetical protein
MRTVAMAVVAVAALGLLANVSLSKPAEPHQAAGIFSPLKPGDSVSIHLNKQHFRYEISTISGQGIDGAQPYRVVEVGSDYLAVRDLAGLTETRIPITAVHSFVRTNLLP